jgi:two-component sensor histidine kinase
MPKSKNRFILPILAGLLATIIVGSTSLFYLSLRNDHDKYVANEELGNKTYKIKSIIEESLSDKFDLSKIIASYVSIHPNINQETFSEFTKEVYNLSSEGLISIQLVKDSTILYNYPLEGNEITIGVNVNELLKDRTIIDYSYKHQTPMIIGPRVLLQGKMGLVYRFPIVIVDPTNPEKTSLWGYSAIVVDLKDLLHKISAFESDNLSIGLISVNQSLSKNGYFYGDSTILKLNYNEIPIELPNDSWKLQVAINDSTPFLFNYLSLQIFFLIFSILIGLLAAFLTSAILQIYKSNDTLIKSNQNIKNQLNEKSAIILEIHHRIKNHFQMISSLNRIIYQNVENREVQKAISDVNNRIGTLATAYSQLTETNAYQSEMNIYIPTLAENLISSVAGDIELILKIEDIKLDIKTTVSLGVIINEMIINTIKHGFPNHQKGTIKISLQIINKEVTLKYLENGIGLPLNVFRTHSESTGILLIQTFSDQLSGSINQISEDEWTGYYLSFPIN